MIYKSIYRFMHKKANLLKIGFFAFQYIVKTG